MYKVIALYPAIHTECINGGIEQGIMEIVGRDNLKPEDQKRLDYFQSLPRNRGYTNDGHIINLETNEIVGKATNSVK